MEVHSFGFDVMNDIMNVGEGVPGFYYWDEVSNMSSIITERRKIITENFIEESTTTSKRSLSSTDTPIPALTYKCGPINNRSTNKSEYRPITDLYLSSNIMEQTYLYEMDLESTTTSKRSLSSTDTPIPALTYKCGPINNRSTNKKSTTTSKRSLSSTDTPIPALTYKSGPINNRALTSVNIAQWNSISI
ncbi:hypothetical protein GQR58_020621 [Nymphon striatum]|nr:hypothetical protein GQR58_020621 [Nymphon striatum]